MKLTVALSLSLLTTGSAFAPIAMKKTALTFSSPAVMFMQDTTAAVEEAMEASETYGKASPEARAAWGLVEELDAANSHEKARLQQLEKKKAELEKLIEDKVEAPTLHEDTSELVKKALMMSRVYGKTSVEAKMAWEAVEEGISLNVLVFIMMIECRSVYVTPFFLMPYCLLDFFFK
mmetsp:Transcript_2601/g.5629  ORF Transcript_2601/g.5629 Transcript_2601/m.5629 type:complete len:177 (+) Transcript_2601:125-655(+)